MPKNPLKSPDLYINRELSWLEFNHRVLQEGLDEELPLLERLKFLAIVGSNLDEFFLVRVAWLRQRRAAKGRRRDISGMTARRATRGRQPPRPPHGRRAIGRQCARCLPAWRSTVCTSGSASNGPTSIAASCKPILPARSSRF